MVKSSPQNETQQESKWGESVLEKWRGALVKARLALHKKREKKKERSVKSTLAKLRKIADAARVQGDDKVPKTQGNTPPSKKRKHSVPRVAKAGVSGVVTEFTSIKIPKRARTIYLIPQPGERSSLDKEPEGKAMSTTSDHAEDAKQRAEMVKKEEIRNRWRRALEFARSELTLQKRKLGEEQKTPVARIEDGAAEDGITLKCPSVDEWRDFAKRAR